MQQTRRVLVVDDEKNIRFTVVHALKGAEIEARTASGGVEGLERLREDSYDLILLDLRMPGMSGLEMLRALRDEEARPTPVIIITAYGTPEQLLEAARLGAVDCIHKPFSLGEVRGKVSEVLLRVEAADEMLDGLGALERGKRALMQGRTGEARHLLEEAADHQDVDSTALTTLGVTLLLERERSGANSAFRRALTIDPTNRTAAEYLSWLNARTTPRTEDE